MVTQGRRLDARDLPNAFDKLLIELMRLGYREPAALDRTECHCQYVIYAKSRIGLLQKRQALEREPGHHEHDRGESNLRRHQNLAESRFGSGHAQVSRSHKLVEIAARTTDCGNESGENSRSDSYGECKDNHERIEAHVDRKRQCGTDFNRT